MSQKAVITIEDITNIALDERRPGCQKADFAYLVQKEVLHSRLGSQVELSTLELRATTVSRLEADGWRIVHRHADSQMATKPPL